MFAFLVGACVMLPLLQVQHSIGHLEQEVMLDLCWLGPKASKECICSTPPLDIHEVISYALACNGWVTYSFHKLGNHGNNQVQHYSICQPH